MVRQGSGMGLDHLQRSNPVDDSRMIYRKPTAPQRHLMLRETEAEEPCRAVLTLFTAGSPSARPVFHEAVSVAASLATWFYDQG
jgi:uncharacterized protein (DUF58 family)